jgi:hypothetical protein
MNDFYEDRLDDLENRYDRLAERVDQLIDRIYDNEPTPSYFEEWDEGC